MILTAEVNDAFTEPAVVYGYEKTTQLTQLANNLFQNLITARYVRKITFNSKNYAYIVVIDFNEKRYYGRIL